MLRIGKKSLSHGIYGMHCAQRGASFCAWLLFIVSICTTVSVMAATTRIVNASNYTTLLNAITAASSGDAIDLQISVNECIDLSIVNKSLSITSSVGGVTWNNCGTTADTLKLNANSYPLIITKITMDNSGGGYVVEVPTNFGNSVTFRQCTLQRTSTSTTDNAVVYDPTINNGSTLAFQACLFSGNAYEYGVENTGGNLPVTDYVFVNCIFRGFSSTSYAALLDKDSNNALGFKIMNCTFYGNGYGYRYSGSSSNGGQYITNSAFAGNTNDVTFDVGLSNNKSKLTYDAFAAIASGMGTGCEYSISATNEFVNPSAGNYHIAATASALKNSSTNVGQGTNTGAPAVDYDGVTRPQFTNVDIGAFEYVASNITPSVTYTPTVSPTFSASPTISGTPTPSLTFSVSPTFSNTGTVTPSFTATRTPTPSSTCTPLMGLVKSANVSTAMFGSTITFTLAYSNDSAGTVNITLTDSVPATLTFMGADNGGAYSAGVVTWTISNVPSYGTGTVNMWGTVSGYPLLPGYTGRHFAISTPTDPWRPAFAFCLKPEEGYPSLE